MWEAFKQQQTGKLYYVNIHTREKSWRAPPSHLLSSPFPQQDIFQHWQAFYSPKHNHELFFLNSLTRECTWTRPAGYFGMPQPEPDCTIEQGKFVQYEGFYYCPQTKLATRQQPANVVSEREAYEELSSKGLLWLGGKEEEKSASPTSSEYSSSESEEEEDDDEEQGKFFDLLRAQKVTHVSRWQNWLPKLAQFPEFTNVPVDKSRMWFEQFVKQSIGADSQQRAALLAKARVLLQGETGRDSFSPETKQALDALKPADRDLVLQQFKT